MISKKQSKKAKDPAAQIGVRHYLQQMKRDWRITIPAILFPGIGSIFIFFIPTYVVARLVGEIANDATFETSKLVAYVAIIGATWLTGEALWRLAFFFNSKVCARGVGQLYENAVRLLLGKDNDFFNNNFAGSLTKNVGGYARNYERFFDTIALDISPNLIPIIFASVILWTYSPYITLLLLGMLVGTFFLALPFIRQRRRLVKIREDASTKLTGHVADIIGNAQAVKSFANEAQEQKTHNGNVHDFVKKAKRSWDYQIYAVDMIIAPLYVLTNVLGLALVIYLGHKSGQLSTEAILVTFGFFASATRALFEFNAIYRDLETSVSEAGQFTTYLLDEPKVTDPEKPQKLGKVSGDIAIENITFCYEKGQDALFSDFSLHIPAGQKVGLVGRSGGGKTSITKLLLRFADVQNGAIKIDGTDIKAVAQTDLRSHMAYVPQEALMFHRTIADNIRYGKQDAPMEEVIAAAKKAHAHEFIKNLPEGYETLVGERGVKLSGGQRQRVAIARAILKDSPILLLDEATSALDSESEKLIQDALWKLIQNRTAIVIAHRLSTIQKMDRIIVLDKGTIIEDGSHEELLKNKGVYAELWTHQSGGFIEE